MPKRLLILALVLASLWGGYWYVGATSMEGAFRSWLDARRADGWTAEAVVETRGFPSRFDTTFTGLTIADPRSGWGWEAPIFQTLMLSYDLSSAMAVLPGQQRVATPAGIIEIESEEMSGRVDFAAAPSLPLDSITVIAREVVAEGFFGRLATEEADFATRRDPTLENGHRIGLLLRETLLPEPLLAALPPEARPPGLPTLRIDARAGLDRPLDRRAAEGDPPRLTALALDAFEFDWGDLSARADGAFDVTDTGVPEGRIDVSIDGFERVQPMLRAILGARAGGLAFGVLATMARAEGDPDTLTAPLTFANGSMSFGPIPLGPAPRF